MGLASIFVRLGLDASGYQTGMKRAESQTVAWGRRISSSIKGYLAAAFSIGAVTAATRSVIRWADSLQDVSDDLTISTRTLQEWEYAAEGTRATLDDFIRAFQFLAKQNPTLNNDQVLAKFNGLADAFKRGDLTLGQMSKQLGKGAAVLSGPFSKGLTDSAEAADRLNRFLSDEQVKALSSVSDGWEKATGFAKAYFAQVILGIANSVKTLGKLNFPAFGPGVIPSKQQIDAMKAQAPFFESDLFGPPLPPGYGRQKPSIQHEEPVTREASSKWSTASVNALQQVGAFIGAQPQLLTEYKEHTRLLRKIADSSEETADAWDQR